MKHIRTIARIDVKNEYAIKGIHLEGLRKVGDPNELAKKYYREGIDEIVFMDAVASYYDRNNLSSIIKSASEEVFVPITVGGGLRNITDIRNALDSGADKVAINTQAIREPEFIREASKIFGSQCIVASIVAKKIEEGRWEAYIENGREPTGVDVIDWVQELIVLGAGEIMVTSLDMEGTKKGFDIELYQAIQSLVKVPLIACGGMKTHQDAVELIKNCSVDALAMASALHYELDSIASIKNELNNNGLDVRI